MLSSCCSQGVTQIGHGYAMCMLQTAKALLTTPRVIIWALSTYCCLFLLASTKPCIAVPMLLTIASSCSCGYKLLLLLETS